MTGKKREIREGCLIQVINIKSPRFRRDAFVQWVQDFFRAFLKFVLFCFLAHSEGETWEESCINLVWEGKRVLWKIPGTNLAGPKLFLIMRLDLEWPNNLLSRRKSSVQFGRSVVTDSLWPHGLQHARLPCPSPTPRAYSNSCPLSRWCHPAISSFVIAFSSCLQSFPTSGPFPWDSSSHQVGKVLEFQLRHQSFQWIFRPDFL